MNGLNYHLRQDFSLIYNLALLNLLIVFGTSFSKFHVLHGIYLHDLLLVLGAFVSLSIDRKKLPHKHILLMLGISVIYLIYSLLARDRLDLIIRQYALFAYLGCYYILNRGNANTSAQQLIKHFLVYLSLFSVLLQTLTISYHIYHNTFDAINSNNHYWFSPGVIVGLIVASATSLLFIPQAIPRYLSFFGVFVLTFTTGHASAQLSVLAILFAFCIINLKRWMKFIPIGIGVIVASILIIKAPQFNDNNKAWRLIIWEYHISDLIKNEYGILGKGFGTPYINQDLEMKLFRAISSTALQERGHPDERYLSPPHNSFITILFSIGIIPGLLIFIPFKKIMKNIFLPFNPEKTTIYYFTLCLVGLTIWCCFNVVLELPHTTGLFWLIYFSFSSVSE